MSFTLTESWYCSSQGKHNLKCWLPQNINHVPFSLKFGPQLWSVEFSKMSWNTCYCAKWVVLQSIFIDVKKKKKLFNKYSKVLRRSRVFSVKFNIRFVCREEVPSTYKLIHYNFWHWIICVKNFALFCCMFIPIYVRIYIHLLWQLFFSFRIA